MLTDDQCAAIRKRVSDEYDRTAIKAGASVLIYEHFLIRAGYAAAMAERAEPVALTFTLAEADALLHFFGGEPGEVTVRKLPAGVVFGDPADPVDEGPSPAGLWAHMTEYPEEGSAYLGPSDDPESTAYAAPPASAVEALQALRAALLWHYNQPGTYDKFATGIRLKLDQSALRKASAVLQSLPAGGEGE